MKCPVCPDSILSMSNRNGIEIDYCLVCRGVWLDRGELDKIIEKSVDQEKEVISLPRQKIHDVLYRDPKDYNKNNYGYSYGEKRKKSFLEELFD